MKVIKVTVDDKAHELMEAAAEYEGMPLALWARVLALKEARRIEHKKLCAPKSQGGSDGETYQWLGKPCTKSEMEAGEKRLALAEANKNKREAYEG